jgi:hypothetical protein
MVLEYNRHKSIFIISETFQNDGEQKSFSSRNENEERNNFILLSRGIIGIIFVPVIETHL